MTVNVDGPLTLQIGERDSWVLAVKPSSKAGTFTGQVHGLVDAARVSVSTASRGSRRYAVVAGLSPSLSAGTDEPLMTDPATQ